MSQRRKIVITIAGFVVGLLASAANTLAAETTYYDEKPWGVYLHTPESPEDGNPYCAIRTTLWDARSVGIEYILEAGDEIGVALRLNKQGWNLPVGETTAVKVQSMVGALATPTMKAISGDELYFKITQFEPESMALGIALKLVFNGQPQPLTVAFEGSEPAWSVPALGLYEAHALDQVFSKCLLDLRGLNVASSGGAAGGATSPFKKSGPTENTTSAPTPATLPSSEWLFSKSEEDWGETCYAETKGAGIKVGFMGSPGKDLIGYVDGLVDGDTIATWRVDEAQSHSLIGGQSDYFGWTQFEVPDDLLDEAAHGRALAITASNGKQLVVSLKGAAEAIPIFNACFAKAPPGSASKSSPVPTEGTKTFRSCLLQVDGKKVIDGACSWGPYGGIGSDFVMEAEGYFAILSTEKGSTARGYWNGERNASHAHSDLGELKKSGNCWTGPKVRLCVQQ
ncbi:hypothetical protein ACCS92_08960 [Rhizobium ruizarguesonis]